MRVTNFSRTQELAQHSEGNRMTAFAVVIRLVDQAMPDEEEEKW